MSEHNRLTARDRLGTRDRGLTLPELLITITVMGIIVAVLSSVIIVTLRNADDVEGRINLADDEQSLEYDMPTDLASAGYVDTDPTLTPCGSACPPNVTLGGSNAVLLSWESRRASGDGVTVATEQTNVSYYFRPTADTGLFELDRIECTSFDGGPWSCTTRTVLEELPGPPGGGLFVPGDTVPSWVIQVSEPLAPDAINEDQFADVSTRKDANRVVVTINGNGGFTGSGGGSSQISITAGGTARSVIDADSTANAPSFVETRSKCGGPVTLIIDNSGSIARDGYGNYRASQVTAVENGVKAFIEAFAGTPTQLQMIRFSTESDTLEPSSAGDAWTHYYDLTDPAQVTEALAQVDPNITANGGTNWEDGWFRTFYEPDGTLQQMIPELTVFFTDGHPTYERMLHRADPGVLVPDAPPAPEPGWPTYDGNYSNGYEYSQVAFNRTDWIADQVRSSTRIIGIGVAGIGTSDIEWIDNPGARYDYDYFRGYRQFQRETARYEKAVWRYQKWRRWGGWKNVSESKYNSHNTTDDSSDGWRRIVRYWTSTSEADYNANNVDSGSSDGYRVASSWAWIPSSVYNEFNTTPDSSDGYRDAGKQWVSSDSAAMDWEPTSQERTDGGFKRDKVYTPTGAYTEAPQSSPLSTQLVLSRLVAGSDHAVTGIWDEATQSYSNADVAEMYLLGSNWSRIASALHSVAMSECGGTVSVSTRVNGSARAADPFTFQNSRLADEADNEIAIEPTVVTTTIQFPTRTFDFDMPGGTERWVDIFPYDLSSLVDYAPAANPWSCRAGIEVLGAGDVQIIPIPDEAWAGVRVKVAPNQAVSCELNVTR